MKKIAILFCLIATSFSQPFNGKDPRAIIEKVKIYRLTQELDLTTEQAIEFFPELNELHKIEKEFNEEIMKILSELKDLLKDKTAEKEVLKTISRYEDTQRRKVESHIKKLKEIWEVLTPIQRAKFLIFQEEFNREIREMIREIKKHRYPKP